MSIVLEQLTKRYEGHPVVNQVSLEIADGEFFVLLGPSGSGKSTVLRMIAGLTRISNGRVCLHDRDVTGLPPQERGVGFVFQHYALFRHMSVAGNIEFALSIRKAPAAERRRRRDELLEMVGLSGLGGRMPAQLSGGQQQRVALARALAHRPEVLLLDEPFGALDAKIRVELRRALRRIQRELGITTVFVTHDQEEAFELADRLGVMNFGRLLEVGPPEELYLRPQTEFVATFLGTANLMVGQSMPEGIRLGPLRFPLNSELSQMEDPRRVQVLFRTEDVALAPSAKDLGCPLLGQGEVEHTTFSGSFQRLRLRLPAIPGVRPIAPPVSFGDDGVLVEAIRSQDLARRIPLVSGDRVFVGVRRLHALLHPGMSFLVLASASPESQAALGFGGQIARLAHARVTVLGHGLDGSDRQTLQEAKEQMGSGLASLDIHSTPDAPGEALALELERRPHDLVVMGHRPGDSLDLLEAVLSSGECHLLLVPQAAPLPTRALVCVAGGEPGKEDILFSGRLLRHLGTEITLLSVLPTSENETGPRERAERFLGAGVRTLELLGVRAATAIRSGSVQAEIIREMESGAHDLLVLGSPLANRAGRVSLSGWMREALAEIKDRPVLIVRSQSAAASHPGFAFRSRAVSIEETLQ